MTELTVEEAGARLKELLARAEVGDPVAILSESGARILLSIDRQNKRPVSYTPTVGKRTFGQWKGLFELSPEFFEPLPDEMLALFYDGPIFPEFPASGIDPHQKPEIR